MPAKVGRNARHHGRRKMGKKKRMRIRQRRKHRK